MKHSIILYRTTCIPNGKTYIGIHKNKYSDPNKFDGYLGSGYLLKLAVVKYGRHNFVRETLGVFSSWDECRRAERQWVTGDYIDGGNTYNIALGGQGGHTTYGLSQQQKDALNVKRQATIVERYGSRQAMFTDDVRHNISKAAKKRLVEHPHSIPDNRNRVYSEKGYQNICDAAARRRGSITITDGVVEKQITIHQDIPPGWWRGRSNNFKKFAHHSEDAKKRISNNPNIRGVVCYNDGRTNVKVRAGENPPPGFVKGMLRKHTDLRWINNGTVETRIDSNTTVPEGYFNGRLFKKRQRAIAIVAESIDADTPHTGDDQTL